MSSADRWAFLETFASRLRTRPERYGWELLAIVVAGLLRYSLDLAFGFTLPFIFFFPTIMLISLLGGLEPSLLATAASALFAWRFLLEPRSSFALSKRSDLTGLLVFIAMGVIMSVAGDLRAQRMQEFEKAVEGLEEMIVVVDRDYRYLIAN